MGWGKQDESGLKNKLVCNFKLVADMDKEFIYGADGSAFLKRELVRFGIDNYQ